MTDFKQVTADFELETKIRRICQDVFSVLLKRQMLMRLSHENVFDFIKESRTMLQNFDERINRNETLCDLIDSKIDARLGKIEVLNKDIQDIKKFCFDGLKGINNEVAGFQAQIDTVHTVLRSQTPIMTKAVTDVERLQQSLKNFKQSLGSVQEATSERVLRDSEMTNAKVDKVRADFDNMLSEVSYARSALASRQDFLDQLTKDIQLFKTYKPEIFQKIRHLYEQVESRALTSEVVSNRRYFDDKMAGYFENVNKTVSKLDLDVKKRLKSNEQRTASIFQAQQDTVTTLKNELNNALNNNYAKQQQLVQSFYTKIDLVQQNFQKATNKIRQQSGFTKQELKQLSRDLQKLNDESTVAISQNKTNIYVCSKRIDKNDEAIKKTDEQILLMNGRITDIRNIIDQINKQQGSQANRFKKIDEMLTIINNELAQQNNRFQLVHKQFDKVYEQMRATEQKHFQLGQQITKIHLSTVETADAQNNRMRLFQSKVQLDLSSFSQKFNQIKEDLKQLNRLSQQLNKFDARFSEQMEESRKFQNEVSQRLQAAMAQLTKYRSDMNIRIDNVNKQTKSLSDTIKNTQKTLGANTLLNNQFSQVLLTMAACNLSRQYEMTADKTREDMTFRFSSMLDGFVVEMDPRSPADSLRYRGELVKRYNLLACSTQYLLKELDSIRRAETLGKGFDGGRTLYGQMQLRKTDEPRRNSVSLRTVNKRDSSFIEFPKLSKKQ